MRSRKRSISARSVANRPAVNPNGTALARSSASSSDATERDGDERHEQLGVPDHRVVGHSYDGGREEVATSEVAVGEAGPAAQHLAREPGVGDDLLVALDRGGVDDGRQEAVAVERPDPRDRRRRGPRGGRRTRRRAIRGRTPATRPSTSGPRTRTPTGPCPRPPARDRPTRRRSPGSCHPSRRSPDAGATPRTAWMIDIPTLLEPVNVSPPRRLSPTSAAPA